MVRNTASRTFLPTPVSQPTAPLPVQPVVKAVVASAAVAVAAAGKADVAENAAKPFFADFWKKRPLYGRFFLYLQTNNNKPI